jgi:predicted nucleic acid-binding protein
MFLDTTFCIDLMRERHRRINGPATRKLSSLGQTPLYVSLFVLCELNAGARLAERSQEEIGKVQRLSELVEVVLPDRKFPVAYGEAEAELRRQGKTIPTMDLLIGVTAKTYGLPILTRDSMHFGRIPELVVEPY